jgi:plasmid segregation protein ParM
VDIGSKTVDIIHTRKHVPVESDCITIPSALIQCMANINNVVYRKTNRTLTEEQIQQVMMYGNAPYSDKMVQIVREELGAFARGIEATLKEHGFDPEMTPVVYVGGGATVMKRFGSVYGNHIMHIEDVKANAIGYEYLAHQQLKRKLL